MAQHIADPSPAPLIVYPAQRWRPEWAIPEVPVSESDTHDVAIDSLRALLQAWVDRTGRDIKVARNLGIRWVREEPRMGFDPDLCLLEPAPDRRQPLHSLRLWEDDHAPPQVAIEVVSPGHPYKDYVDTPARCAACGVRELWVFDPMLVGPHARRGPHLLQLWHRREDGGFERISAGSNITYSPFLDAWLVPRASHLASDARLLISVDPAGEGLWLTREEELRVEARRAIASEQRAIASEQQARASEQQARASEKRALDSEQQARASEKRALDSEQQARASEQQALASEKRALDSEKRALDSEQQALASEKRALDSEQQALVSEKRALDSEQQALASEKRALDALESLRSQFDERISQLEARARRE